MKSTKIRDFKPLLEYNPDTSFTIVPMKENNNRKFNLQKVKEGITYILLKKFFDCLNYAEKNVIWLSFRINNLVGKNKEE